MLFGKYHIVILRERGGSCRNLFMRGWCGIAGVLFVASLMGLTIWLAGKYLHTYEVEQRLAEAEKTIEEQSTQLLAMTGKLQGLQADLTRVQQFDTKLRLMINMEKDPTEVQTSMGGSRTEDLSKGYLPLHRQELLARKMHTFIKQLATDVRLEEVRQQELLHALRANRDILAATPSIWPTEGFISSTFGSRKSPFTSRGEFHKGLDINNRPGTPIWAPARGTVTFAGTDGAYGNCVILQHGAGLSTRYAHMQRFVVKEGQSIQRGDIIGYVGSSGRTTGPHLHYEVRVNGVCVNPMRYILN
ncbi:M23 family metallopeptidase [Nitratidesulfovibrio vulgaris]|nr:M23 family metallopeptidase [Nitratidesulfovibrio vulgaris]ABM27172.1 peptidase M23B [Nitratidesulfovibrio vulgaris DP4]ADP88138.1 Peptidase M23 [Nitratidesulfovibrio vulgaris RCH1]WCB47999.1 peptidoglycan DD-metalloendopeptidase family protein [Nitratidesulfovibrio vulgaris]GEB78715.1 peptidase M24 [Desulfovibrio desulfuricans]